MTNFEEIEIDPVETVEEYEGLSVASRDALVAETVEAYKDTNIDGYGDEGEGYDGDKFVQNLIAMGWVFKGKEIY